MLLRLLLYLLVQKENCVYTALSVYFSAANIMLELEAHRSIRGFEAVCVECMPLKSILWHMHVVDLSHRIPYLSNLILQMQNLVRLILQEELTGSLSRFWHSTGIQSRQVLQSLGRKPRMALVNRLGDFESQ